MLTLIAIRQKPSAAGSAIAEADLKRFKFHGPIGTGNGHPIWETLEHSDALMGWLWQAIGSGAVISAAIVSRRPEPDRLWIAAEWFGRIVVELSLSQKAGIAENLWRRDANYSRDDLIVFQRLEAPLRQDDRDARAGEKEDLPPEPGLFRACLRDQLPRTTMVPLGRLMREPDAWFGELAREDVGGSVALLSAALDRGPEFRGDDQMIRLGNPAACGFEWADGESSLPHWIRKEQVRVQAHGDGFGKWEQEAIESRFMLPPDVPGSREWNKNGWHFLVMIELTGLVDPQVIFGSGAVFEQPQLNGSQNLAIARGGTVTVDAGQTIQIALPAWCLNARFRSPHGPMRPTPFRYVHHGSGQQEAVWTEIEGRRRRGND